jgi:hypothetical protein
MASTAARLNGIRNCLASRNLRKKEKQTVTAKYTAVKEMPE